MNSAKHLSERIKVLIVVGLFFVSQIGFASRSAPDSVTERWFDQNGEEIKTALNGRVTYDKNAAANPDDPVYEYDSNDNITKITYPDGTYVTREYNGPNGEMTKEVNEGGITTTYAYDSEGNLTNKVEAEGASCARETHYTYDANGNMLSSEIMNPSGTNHEIRFTYDASGRVLTQTDAMGNVTTNSYDKYGNMVQSTVYSPQSTVLKSKTYIFDALDRVVGEQDETGNIITNTYDLAGNLIRRDVLNAMRSTLSAVVYQYDSENRPVASTNELGLTTRTVYDSDGHVIEKSDIAGRTIKYEYNLKNKVICEIRAEGTYSFEYDEQDRMTRQVDPHGLETRWEYSGDTENPLKIIYPTFTREYTYDARNRVTQVDDLVNGTIRSTLYALDSLGRVISQTDPLGRTTRYEYDTLGRKTAEVNALNATNRFEYDVFGNMTKLTDAKGNETRYEYDLAGNLVKKTYADNSHVAYTYDAQNRLIEKIDAKGQKTTYAYDAQGLLVTNLFYNAAQTLVKTVTYGYDAKGRMTSWDDGTYSGTYGYDEPNRIMTATVNYGAFSKSYTYRYDLAGRKTSFTYPSPTPQHSDAPTLSFSYDVQGHLVGMTIPGEGTVSYSYGLQANSLQPMLLSSVLPGGAQKSFTYDSMSTVISNSAVDPAGNPVMTRAYSRQLTGNILAQETEQGYYSYQYDMIDQLTNVAVNAYSGPSGIATNESFAYDAMGNRAGYLQGTNSFTYAANTLNQYSSIENRQSEIENYEYDQNGNQLVHYRALFDGSIITNHLAWDIENRLVSISNQQGDVANYSYDPFGRRLSKVFNGVTNYYLYADEGLVAEYDGEGNMTREYGWTPGSLWMNNLVFMKMHSGGSTNYYYALNDHLGSLQKLITANGSVVWSMAQDAFGRAVVSSDSTIICNLRFSSQYYDAEFGLNYNDQRYFDPVNARYLSQDSIEEKGGYNLYAFLQNNSINAVDLYGNKRSGIFVWWSDTRPMSSDVLKRARCILSKMNLSVQARLAFYGGGCASFVTGIPSDMDVNGQEFFGTIYINSTLLSGLDCKDTATYMKFLATLMHEMTHYYYLFTGEIVGDITGREAGLAYAIQHEIEAEVMRLTANNITKSVSCCRVNDGAQTKVFRNPFADILNECGEPCGQCPEGYIETSVKPLLGRMQK